MKNTTVLATVLCSLAALFAVGCDKPADKTDTSTATTATVTATPATTATAGATAETIAEADLATPADFEEEAAKAITARTYKAELASLETEMSKD